MISIIVAKTKNGVIGKGDGLPWNLPGDLKHFAKVTKGHTVIMGRKTYESIVKKLGHALPGRKNVIITSQGDFQAPGCLVIHSVSEVMFPASQEEVFIIGGGEVYKEFMPLAKKLYITEVSTECEGDVYFPPFTEKDWELTSAIHNRKDAENQYDFTFLEFVRK